MAACLAVKMSWPAATVHSIRSAERVKIKEEMSICAADCNPKRSHQMSEHASVTRMHCQNTDTIKTDRLSPEEAKKKKKSFNNMPDRHIKGNGHVKALMRGRTLRVCFRIMFASQSFLFFTSYDTGTTLSSTFCHMRCVTAPGLIDGRFLHQSVALCKHADTITHTHLLSEP